MKTKITDEQIINKYNSLKSSAKSRNLKFNLTLQSVKNLLRATRCKYTGKLFDGVVCIKSVDRIDSSKGYIIGNVVACDVQINSLKGNMSTKDIIRLGKQLQKLQNKP